MSNDENKSLQQSLPLSWEEESENNLEEQAPPKKLLLRREEEHVPAPPKPLLLKKSSEVEYREQLDNLDTIYDKAIDDEDLEEEHLEDETTEEDFDEHAELEDEHIDEDLEEEHLEDETTEEDFDEHAELEDEHAELEDEHIDEDLEEEPAEEAYDSAFEDSGTFTLDDSPSDEGSAIDYSEDEVEEDRVEIAAESFSDLNDGNSESEIEDHSSSVEEDEIEASSIESSSEEEDKPAISEEESVFALKADTYYEVQTEDKTAEPEPVDESQSEVVQHYDEKTLGALLQEARLSCSFTIKDAAEATRIKSSYIIALENNEMDELPAKVYVLNYIRQLCREYNVSNEPIIEAFERQNDSNKSNSDIKIMRVGDEDARKATKPNSKLNALVVGTSLLTLTALFLIAWYMKWFNPSASPENVDIEIKLEEIRPEVKLPAPELPIPNQ